MFDHIYNAITGMAEIAIWWMIWQDYRKARGKPELEFKMPAKRWAVMVLLSLGPIAAVYLARLEPHFDFNAKIVLVADKTFRNERVEVDAHEFRNCTFDNVSLVYNGRAPFKMIGNRFVSTLMITTEDPSVGTTIGLLSSLGFMPGIERYSDEPVTVRKEH